MGEGLRLDCKPVGKAGAFGLPALVIRGAELIDRLTLLAALALAAVSAGFSIYGLTSIFVGAFWGVIGMGVALELGKLRAVTWIDRNGSAPWWGLKGAMTVLVLVLMGLNVVGAFGFLAKAHIGRQVEGDVAVASRTADVEARLSVQAEKVADLTKQIADLDATRTIESDHDDASCEERTGTVLIDSAIVAFQSPSRVDTPAAWALRGW